MSLGFLASGHELWDGPRTCAGHLLAGSPLSHGRGSVQRLKLLDREGVRVGLAPTQSDEDARYPPLNRDREGVPMALRAAEWDEDVRLPAPNRDGDGAGVFNGAGAFYRDVSTLR